MDFAAYLLEFKDFVFQLLHPEEIIRTGGLLLIVLIIFAETGLFFGFFLPGDSLLFTAGLMTALGVIDHSIAIVLGSVLAAAIAGDFIGYWFGKKTGVRLFQKKDTFLFKQAYLTKAKVFYDRHGSLAIVMGRFIPIIRTFAPIIAGVVQLNFRRFMIYNASGALIWVLSMILSGYFLGMVFPQVIHYLELIVVGLILVSALPMIKAFWKKKSARVKTAGLPVAKLQKPDLLLKKASVQPQK